MGNPVEFRNGPAAVTPLAQTAGTKRTRFGRELFLAYFCHCPRITGMGRPLKRAEKSEDLPLFMTACPAARQEKRKVLIIKMVKKRVKKLGAAL